MATPPNEQYNVASADSVPVRIAGHQRRKMFDRFIYEMVPTNNDAILDVGVTSERSYPSSNYFEKWYSQSDRITAVGLDDAQFLEEEFPGLTFLKADARDLPFADREFDYVHSSAVIEHVGNATAQAKVIGECARVAGKGFFLTTPNRWFPVEFHTVVPFLHWLPPRAFRAIMRAIGREFFASEENLNLMSASDLRAAVHKSDLEEEFDVKIESVSLGGWPSNLLLVGKRKLPRC